VLVSAGESANSITTSCMSFSQQGLLQSCAGVHHTRENRYDPANQTAPRLDRTGIVLSPSTWANDTRE
jgi:hypothetical protein